MRYVFLTPHTKVSGGTKVIIRFAEYVNRISKDNRVAIVAKKLNPTYWMCTPKLKEITCNLVVEKDARKKHLKNADVIVDYLDGDPEEVKDLKKDNAKHILLLQGYGTQNEEKENRNLSYPYDAVIATSSWLARLALKANHEKVFVIPPAVDEIFRPLPKLFSCQIPVGGLLHSSEDKNSDVLLAALSMAASQGAKRERKYKAMLVAARVEYAKKELFQNMHCQYAIFIDPPTSFLPLIYNQCKVWVATSKNEGFGLPPLEAMACGVPVVWTKNKGLEDYLVSGKNCLVSDGTKKDLMAKIGRLINERSLREQITKNGMILAQSFKWSKQGARFVNTVKKITGE